MLIGVIFLLLPSPHLNEITFHGNWNAEYTVNTVLVLDSLMGKKKRREKKNKTTSLMFPILLYWNFLPLSLSPSPSCHDVSLWQSNNNSYSLDQILETKDEKDQYSCLGLFCATGFSLVGIHFLGNRITVSSATSWDQRPKAPASLTAGSCS